MVSPHTVGQPAGGGLRRGGAGTLEIKAWCMAEVDIFRDLSKADMDASARPCR